jgi:MFS family permease
MSNKTRQTLFVLSILGDFGNSLLLVTSIAYGVTLTTDPLTVGLIGAAYGLTYLITPAILGWLGDRFPRKTSLIIASSGQTVIAVLLFIFANSPLILIMGQIGLGIVYGFFWPSIQAYISETSESRDATISEQTHKKGILLFCVAWSIGYMIGPLVAGIFSQYFRSGAYITVIIVYIAELFLILINLPKIKPMSNSRTPLIAEERNTEKINDRNRVNTIISFTELVVTVFLYAFISKTLFTYFTDYSLDPNGLQWVESLMGTVLFMFGLGRTSFFIVNYFWVQIRSSMKLILFTFLGMGICVLGIPLTSNAVLLSIIIFFIGVCAGIVYSSSLDLMLHQVQNKKGAKAGIFESMVGLGSILAPLLTGWVARKTQLAIPFYVVSGITMFFFMGFLFLEFIMRKKN